MTDKPKTDILKKDILKKDILKKDILKKDHITLILKKITFFEDIIQKTILHIQRNKMLDIICVSDQNTCINTLFELSQKTHELNKQIDSDSDSDSDIDTNNIINILQHINNELSSLFKIYGTDSFEDLLWICFGNNSVNTYAISDMDKHKFELFKKYFHPTSYKMLPLKKTDSDNVFTEKSKNLDTSDVNIIKSFHLKVYGIQIIIHNKKSIIMTGIIDDVIVDILSNKFITLKQNAIKQNIPVSPDFQGDTFTRYMKSLSLKDYLIYEPHEIYLKYAGYLSNLNTLRQKTTSHVVKEFISNDLFTKRLTIIQLLIKSDKYDNQYLAYLLYDLLSVDVNGSIDTLEQTILFDSFPWSIKQFFKDAMKKTIQYTNELTNFDSQKIPLEHQICLLKAPDSVKEKAMQKLKEIKSKSEDSGSKARQYLDGLLKIPFSIYRREPILNMMNEIKCDFKNLLLTNNANNAVEIKDKYSSLEIIKYMKELEEQFTNVSTNVNTNVNTKVNTKVNTNVTKHLSKCSKKELSTYILKINDIITKYPNSKMPLLNVSNKTKSDYISQIVVSLNSSDIYNKKELKEQIEQIFPGFETPKLIPCISKQINDKYAIINKYMNNVKSILDTSVHAHSNAKNQVERIVAQWISGNDNTGYVLGFEGSPGIGKTTLAKGLANCLKDDEGNSRPFSLIAIGGDANSTSLVGHSYTYVGSTWGQIVQILMDKKCMNPIILIDEVDKISKTEHGKEIIGILTHLLDTTQNEAFQDKYFSGIELDLSKVLFILSYNDVEAIDNILLDRVHRIKFDNLSVEDKIEISIKHLLPEIYKKVGLEQMIQISPETLKFIIEEYTLEPGVRKLKEKLFEIIGEINLEIMKNTFTTFTIPIVVTIDEIKNKYFKDKREVKIQKIHEFNRVGAINCLYATNAGSSGILSASAKFFPSKKFLELKMTGLLDQMMQESFQISLTIAFNLLTEEEKLHISTLNENGIHLHMGDGSVSKSGTSAGIAVTLLMYSLLSGKKIKNTFAVTGEAADLNGKVGEIGALTYKFKGGIKAGVKHFIFPYENSKDYDEFMIKYGKTDLVQGISFHQINHISEAITLIME